MAPEIDSDSQARAISEGLQKLYELLETPVARNALDLSKNAATAMRYEILGRLRKSLRQYLGRDGDLFYVGLLGHFSAGKSSTINSLLQGSIDKYERATGLNPTDTTITLITQAKNSNSLLGVIREGHVTIRHEAVESPMLESLVLVDTPGTGDPQFMEEIARDFLPICDVILFLLSAASPLDKSDVPLLTELHRRLPFIPLHFVITRADELRADASKPLTDVNIDQAKAAHFLSEIVGRVNVLLKPDVYTAEQFMLLDNRSRFNVDKLRQLLGSKCNSSSTQARVSMHVNKLRFYQSSAKELRDFFAGFLETKLLELNKIVASASRNIDRYQQIVQISNSNLTKAWLDHNGAINDARTRAIESLKALPDLPDDYPSFVSLVKARLELSRELYRDARYSAGSISAKLKSEVIASLRDHFYTGQKLIADTSFVDLAAANLGFTSIVVSHDFSDSDLISSALLVRKYNDWREAQANSLRDYAGSLRRALREVEELIQARAPFADCESVIEAARQTLAKDLGNFFQNVELYRNGVFSHTTKESISTLGIGRELDALESEFTDEDKASQTAEALSDLFPGFTQLAANSATSLAGLGDRVRSLSEGAHAVGIETPETSSQMIGNAAASARPALYAEMLRSLQTDVDRLCGNVRAQVASLLVTTRAEYDAEMRRVNSNRRRRYSLIAAGTALVVLVGVILYRHSGLPAPKSWSGTLAMGILSGFVVEALVLLGVRARENFPKVVVQTRERFHVGLNDKVRQSVEQEVRTQQFDALNESSIGVRLNQAYEHIFSVSTDSWEVRAAQVFGILKRLRLDYSALRDKYLAFIDEIHRECTEYFGDASRNLGILNTAAGRIKARAIEPSFRLLDATREQLEFVKKDVAGIDFT